MQRGLYLSAMRMALVSVLPERAMLSGANFNTTDSTKPGGGVAKANNAGAASTGPNLHPMRYLRKQFFSVLLVV